MNTVKITKIEINETEVDVHDIEVDNAQHYFLENGMISHNSGPIFAASIVASLQKRKLKEDEDGNKISDVTGIRSAVKIAKSRYSKPFEGGEIKIPYESGMNPYSGLSDFFEKHGFLTKEGNKWKYIDQEGTEHKLWRKEYDRNLDGILDKMMTHFMKLQEELPQEEIGVGIGVHDDGETTNL